MADVRKGRSIGCMPEERFSIVWNCFTAFQAEKLMCTRNPKFNKLAVTFTKLLLMIHILSTLLTARHKYISLQNLRIVMAVVLEMRGCVNLEQWYRKRSEKK